MCRDLKAAVWREWLETNGLGGFASSTIIGLNTRRYHGLLVAALEPPLSCVVLLSKLEDTLIIDGRRFDLSANQYPGVIHPRGFQYLKQFRLDPFPIFTYEVGGIEIEKSVFMIQGQNSTVVLYEFRVPGSGVPGERVEADSRRQTARDCVLEVRPLTAFRDYHSTTHENNSLNPTLRTEDGVVTMAFHAGLPALVIAHDADEVETSGYWYHNFEYQVERERGLDFVEDLFSPLSLKFDLSGRIRVSIIASTEPQDISAAATFREAEINRRKAVLSTSPSNDNLTCWLSLAADQFVVERGDRKTIIAGYHWFTDWGRDTMIALPGLTLVRGEFEAAKRILVAYSRQVGHGLLPNRFPDGSEEPEYNTVDATLWFFDAVRAFLEYTGDYSFIKANLFDLLADIISWHVRGTRFSIHVDDDGLLTAGEDGVQLTWMDAKVDDWVVTPRRGKPVEVQALWYNALRVMEDLAYKFGDKPRALRYRQLATWARGSFNHLFWNSSADCLFDVVSGDGRDASIRPNQIFSVSLPYSMLSRDRARSVVDVVQRELLTPYGLRSLASSDEQYHGRYQGNPNSRDGAYHQGTAWAWLMGPFITAYTKVHGRTTESRQQAAKWLANFHHHLCQAGLGQVSEIFDGDAPHRPRGCIAQAWSVAELLRAAVEDSTTVGSH